MKKKLRVAVTGIGWCGCEHIKAFQTHPDCEVALLHGRDETRVRENLSRFGVKDSGARVTTREDDLFTPDIDIVSIAGINSSHAPLAIRAAESGKHVMLEKPVARDEAELTALLQAFEGRDIKTVVSFELYWNPLFKVARWLLERGRLGKVMFVRSNYHSRVGAFYSERNWTRTRAEARSFLINAGCHSVDAVRQFANDQPQSVSAFQTTGIEQGYEYPTTIHTNIQFTGGLLGQVSASADVASPYHFGLEIYGSQLSLVNQHIRWPYDQDVDVEKLRKECPVEGARFHREPYSEAQEQLRVDCILPNSVSVDHHPFREEAAALVDAIQAGGQTPLPLSRAAITHRICYAADRSAEQNGRAIPFDQ